MSSSSAMVRSKPRMPKSTTRTFSGHAPLGQLLDDFDAERVVTQEDVADAGDQNARRHIRLVPWLVIGQRFDFLGPEEKAVSGLSRQAHVLAGIIFDGHGEINAVFVVLLDRDDGGDLTFHGDVEDVGVSHAAIAAPGRRRDRGRRRRGWSRALAVRWSGPSYPSCRSPMLKGRNPRKVPWSPSIWSFSSDSVRARTARAR